MVTYFTVTYILTLFSWLHLHSTYLFYGLPVMGYLHSNSISWLPTFYSYFMDLRLPTFYSYFMVTYIRTLFHGYLHSTPISWLPIFYSYFMVTYILTLFHGYLHSKVTYILLLFHGYLGYLHSNSISRLPTF